MTDPSSIHRNLDCVGILQAVITLIFMFMPAGVPSVLLTAMTLVIGFMVHIARGGMFAVPSEVKYHAAMRLHKLALSVPSVSAGPVPGRHVWTLDGYLRKCRVHKDIYIYYHYHADWCC